MQDLPPEKWKLLKDFVLHSSHGAYVLYRHTYHSLYAVLSRLYAIMCWTIVYYISTVFKLKGLQGMAM